MSLYLGENKIADNTCSRNIGEIVASTIPLSDAGLHLLDGALINGAGSYAKFVNYISGLVTDYPDLFVSESDWQSAVTTYGVCGKFVYDSTNNTVRLPKITGFTEGTIDPTVLGDLTQAGLPNITGACSLGAIAGTSWSLIGKDYSGAFQPTSSANPASYGQGFKDGSQTSGLKINASASNSIYGNSSTVQPQSIKVLYYIVIASSITNELNLDVADMANKDLDNVTKQGFYRMLAEVGTVPDRFIVANTTAGRRHLTIKANTFLKSGDYYLLNTSDRTLSIESLLDESSIQNGKDYYIYLNTDGTLTCSRSYTLSTGRIIGGFHTECADVGTVSDHPLNGYLAGDILPESVWCLNHYALNASIHKHKGLVYNATTDKWVDIYNMSTSGTSEYGAARANTMQHYYFSELARANGKQLIDDETFYSASKGSNQKTAVSGSAQPNPDTTGGHVDTANRRMTSAIGCEEMCGLQWQHLSEYTSAGGSNWNGQNGDEGDFYGICMVRLAGGHWGDSSLCGSRCRGGSPSLSFAAAPVGGRAAVSGSHSFNPQVL